MYVRIRLESGEKMYDKMKKYETPVLEVTKFDTEDCVMAPYETTTEYGTMSEVDNPASGDWGDF